MCIQVRTKIWSYFLYLWTGYEVSSPAAYENSRRRSLSINTARGALLYLKSMVCECYLSSFIRESDSKVQSLIQLSNKSLMQLSNKSLMQLSNKSSMQLSNKSSMQLSNKSLMQLSKYFLNIVAGLHNFFLSQGSMLWSLHTYFQLGMFTNFLSKIGNYLKNPSLL
jgi:hypothetical protein